MRKKGENVKRVATIQAKDHDVDVTIRIEVNTTQMMTKDESAGILRDVIRNTARGLETVRLTNFGIDNTKINTRDR